MNHSTVLPTEKAQTTRNPFAPNPLTKAMGFTTPALPVDDLTLQCAAMTPQQQDMLLFLLSQMAAVSRPQGGKP